MRSMIVVRTCCNCIWLIVEGNEHREFEGKVKAKTVLIEREEASSAKDGD